MPRIKPKLTFCNDNTCIDLNCIKENNEKYINNEEENSEEDTEKNNNNEEDLKFRKRIKCTFENCNKIPIFNYQNETKALYCFEHKLDNMIDIINKKCLNCNLRAYYNLPNEKSALYCKNHKKDNMIIVTNKNCLDCNKKPGYNYKNLKTPIYCKDHKKDNMVDVKNLACIECDKRATYNIKGQKPLYCKTHKKKNMIDVRSITCLHDNCNKQPIFNLPDQKKPLYCLEHKQSKMIDIKNKKCIGKLCDTRGPKRKIYKGYCLRCFINTFPDEPVSKKYYKIKEKHIADFVRDNFKDLEIIFDKQIDGGCSKKRPDIFIELLTHCIIIECDENQHKDYNCENKRTMKIFIDLGNRPIVFIRFNPDKYINNEKISIPSCFGYHETLGIPIILDKNDWNNRLSSLKLTINKYINNIPEKEITIEKLFFDFE